MIDPNETRQQMIETHIDDWNYELTELSEFARNQPQAAYLAFVGGFTSKLIRFMRKISDISAYLEEIEEKIMSEFIPSISDGITCSRIDRLLISLPVRYGGLAIPVFSEIAPIEYENSSRVSAQRAENRNGLNRVKNEITARNNSFHLSKLDCIRGQLNERRKRLNEINQEQGASSWLSKSQLADDDFQLNKQEFCDSIRIRYGWELSNLPTFCTCGANFDFQHAMSCKNGGLVISRHDSLRDLISDFISKVCYDTELEVYLPHLPGERAARLDVRARGFWSPGLDTFFDIRVFDPNADSNLSSAPEQLYVRHEREKKRKYNQRICKQHGSFTPLVFSLYGGCGRETNNFISKLAVKLCVINKSSKSVEMNWIRSKISFDLLKSCLRCLHRQNVDD